MSANIQTRYHKSSDLLTLHLASPDRYLSTTIVLSREDAAALIADLEQELLDADIQERGTAVLGGA